MTKAKKLLNNLSLEDAIIEAKNNGLRIDFKTSEAQIKTFARMCIKRRQKAINATKHYHGR